MMNLYQYDLNLLTIFDMIFRELHLTRAGKKLNMSQPAMSQALKKLRSIYQDQLFLRKGNYLVATERAQEIALQVGQIVELAKMSFENKAEFDPATSNRTFKLAMSDYTEMVIMPKLFKRIRNVAPHVKIENQHLTCQDYYQILSDGELDLVLASIDFVGSTYRQFLFYDHEVVIVRKDSKALKSPLNLERYIAYDHAQFQWIDEVHRIDQILNQQKRKRKIVLEVQHEMVLPLILQDNDLLVNMPLRMAQVFQKLLPLEILEIPVEICPYEFYQFWHERKHGDLAHSWLRKEIAAVAQSLD